MRLQDFNLFIYIQYPTDISLHRNHTIEHKHFLAMNQNNRTNKFLSKITRRYELNYAEFQ